MSHAPSKHLLFIDDMRILGRFVEEELNDNTNEEWKVVQVYTPRQAEELRKQPQDSFEYDAVLIDMSVLNKMRDQQGLVDFLRQIAPTGLVTANTITQKMHDRSMHRYGIPTYDKDAEGFGAIVKRVTNGNNIEGMPIAGELLSGIYGPAFGTERLTV